MIRHVTLALLLLTACARTVPAQEFNGTDHAWIQLMIPMNEQMLPLLDLARERAVDRKLKRQAAQIRDSHLSELEALRRLRDAADLPTDNIHTGHTMPGLVTATEVDTIERSSEAEFDRLFTASLRAHLEQTGQLARSEQQAGIHGRCKELAGSIIESRDRQLGELA